MTRDEEHFDDGPVELAAQNSKPNESFGIWWFVGVRFFTWWLGLGEGAGIFIFSAFTSLRRLHLMRKQANAGQLKHFANKQLSQVEEAENANQDHQET